jgi:hypothetical protein
MIFSENRLPLFRIVAQGRGHLSKEALRIGWKKLTIAAVIRGANAIPKRENPAKI